MDTASRGVARFQNPVNYFKIVCSPSRFEVFQFGEAICVRLKKQLFCGIFNEKKKRIRIFLPKVAASKKAADVSRLLGLSIGIAVPASLRQILLNTSCFGLLFFCKFW